MGGDLDLVDLIMKYGAEIGAGASLIFLLLEVFIEGGRPDRRSWKDNIKTVLLLAGAAVTMGFAYWSLQRNYEPMTSTTFQADTIREFYDRCRTRLETLSVEEQADLVGERFTRIAPERRADAYPIALRHDCLALAIRHADERMNEEKMHPVEPNRQTAWLYQDIALGNALLEDFRADGSIGSVLYDVYGVNSEEFLGVGRSLPANNTDDANASRYSEAVVREYLAPNLCAEDFNKANCPQRSTRLWAWTFTSMEEVEGKTVRDILRDMAPRQGGEAGNVEYQRLRERVLGETPDFDEPTTLLARFHMFPKDFYVGTAGRPEARYVFFSNLEDVIDLPLREAYARSGADDAFRRNESGREINAFLWIYMPADARGAWLATWRNLFIDLRRLRVHPRIQEIATAERWPPRAESQ